MSGNVGIISVKPIKIPEPDREIVLNTHLRRGDNSFQLIAGERLVFTHLNGDKPAYMVIRADAMLTGNVCMVDYFFCIGRNVFVFIRIS